MKNDSLKITITIPSYWTRASGKGLNKDDAIYDHPTPLDCEGTLKRTLDSINVLKNKNFNLVVIAVSTAQDIEQQVEEKVTNIIKSTSLDVEVILFSNSQLRQIHNLFIAEEKKEFVGLLNLRGYSNIRNLCLFIPCILDSDVALLIDDDEVFDDPDFISKATEYIGKNLDNKPIYAITGYVINANGDYRVSKQFHSWMKFWDKNERMNEAFDKMIGREPRMKETPFALGGNMVIHRNLFSVVPFDPNIPRGEDTDFLMNARMFGFSFFLDNKLSILHLPPPKSHPIWMRLREDIYRFVYERAKIENQKDRTGMTCVHPGDFDPYPGCFLKKDFEEKVEKACRLLSREYLSKGDRKGCEEILRNIDIAKHDAVPKYDPFDALCVFQKHWYELLRFSRRNTVHSRILKVIKT